MEPVRGWRLCLELRRRFVVGMGVFHAMRLRSRLRLLGTQSSAQTRARKATYEE